MSAGVLARCRAGEISPPIALAQMVIAGALPEQQALDALAREEAPGSPVIALATLAGEQRERLEALQRVAASGIDPVGDDPVAATAALFDRLAGVAPEAAVAFYSLGDPALLDAATAELVATIRAWAAVDNADILDLGCGIGRVSFALAGEARSVLGLDVSSGMVEVARQRGAHAANVRFATGTGRDLAGVPDASIDLLLAIDTFPYVIRAGLLDEHMAEAARVIRPGGTLLVFNWSYRGDAAGDVEEAKRLAPLHGFDAVRLGEMPFRIWDGTGFQFVRPA